MEKGMWDTLHEYVSGLGKDLGDMILEKYLKNKDTGIDEAKADDQILGDIAGDKVVAQQEEDKKAQAMKDSLTKVKTPNALEKSVNQVKKDVSMEKSVNRIKSLNDLREKAKEVIMKNEDPRVLGREQMRKNMEREIKGKP